MFHRSAFPMYFLFFVTIFALNTSAADYPIQPVPFNKVYVMDSFWSPRLKTNQDITIPYALEKCEETGRIENFRIAAGLKEGGFQSLSPFDDSDVYKIMEGASYSLTVNENKELDERLDKLIGLIAQAQEDDGYLYTARTIPSASHDHWLGDGRWSNLRISHELYNLGHFYEAAAAHYQATGKRSMLNVAIKSADLIDRDFGPGKRHDVPGHEEIEIGLAKLYRVTGDQRYLDLAKFFLDERGHPHGRELYGAYCQDHKPVVEQSKAVGHAVRAVYLYSGMADIAAMTGDRDYIAAIDRIWNDVVSSKLYLTGGIGATGRGEAFGKGYELPNLSAYNETCAAIGNIFWNYRMFLLHGEAKYIDVLERTLYNGMLSGYGLEGDRFFYPNPLACGVGGNSRSPWFGCACCPSNVTRFMPSIPGYAYAHKDDTIYVNLFIQSDTVIHLGDNKVNLRQETRYPWDGQSTITVLPARESEFTMAVRIPGWAQNQPVPTDLYRFLHPLNEAATIRINGEDYSYDLQNGYARIQRHWKLGDQVTLHLPMKVRRVVAHANVKADRNKVALQVGPLVYCVEWPDYNESVFNLLLEDDAPLQVRFRNDLLGGINVIEGKGYALEYRKNRQSPRRIRKSFTAIPYYARSHRGEGEMTVWLAHHESAARPKRPPTIASKSTIQYSFKRDGGESQLSEKALNDGVEPKNSDDPSILRFHWWPHAGTREWVQYDFDRTYTLSSTSVYWFDDTGHGGCRVPASWQLLYKKGTRWIAVNTQDDYGTEKDRFNHVSFEPVRTRAVRLEVKLQDKMSGGIMEWIVE